MIASAYQVMPDLSPDDFEALKADISARGVLVPVEYDDEYNVIDGHHRIRACNELGIRTWPKIVRIGLTEDEKRTHARQLNLARRQLNRDQKQQLIREQLKETPEKSDRQIASSLGVSHHTVSNQRNELQSGGQIAHLIKSVGADGKEYPRRPAALLKPDPIPIIRGNKTNRQKQKPLFKRYRYAADSRTIQPKPPRRFVAISETISALTFPRMFPFQVSKYP